MVSTPSILTSKLVLQAPPISPICSILDLPGPPRGPTRTSKIALLTQNFTLLPKIELLRIILTVAIARIPAGNPSLLLLQSSLICSILALCREMRSFSRSWTHSTILCTTDLIAHLHEDIVETAMTVVITQTPPNTPPFILALQSMLTVSSTRDLANPYVRTHTAPAAPTFLSILFTITVLFVRTPVPMLMYLIVFKKTIPLAVPPSPTSSSFTSIGSSDS